VPHDPLLYLSACDVAGALESVDVVAAVTAALTAHGNRETILPAEAYLRWEHAGETLRSLSMPGLVDGCAGVKIINANPEAVRLSVCQGSRSPKWILNESSAALQL